LGAVLRCMAPVAALTRSPDTLSMHMQTLEKDPLPSRRTSSYRSPSCAQHRVCHVSYLGAAVSAPRQHYGNARRSGRSAGPLNSAICDDGCTVGSSQRCVSKAGTSETIPSMCTGLMHAAWNSHFKRCRRVLRCVCYAPPTPASARSRSPANMAISRCHPRHPNREAPLHQPSWSFLVASRHVTVLLSVDWSQFFQGGKAPASRIKRFAPRTACPFPGKQGG
jgi:hypothetical protein